MVPCISGGFFTTLATREAHVRVHVRARTHTHTHTQWSTTQLAFARLYFVLQGQTFLLLHVSLDFLLFYSSPL